MLRPPSTFWRPQAYLKASKALYSSSKSSPETPKNVLEPHISAHKQPENGIIYDKKPFKATLEPNKKYFWCLCGYSKSQPFCDGTHKNVHMKIKLRPVAFQVDAPKDYWLCNCKQTHNRPFCDGTHKTQKVIEGTSTIRQ